MYLLKFVNCSVLSFILPFIIFIAKRSSKSYLFGTYQIIFLIFYGGMFSTGNYQIIFLIFYGGMYSTKAHRKELRLFNQKISSANHKGRNCSQHMQKTNTEFNQNQLHKDQLQEKWDSRMTENSSVQLTYHSTFP